MEQEPKDERLGSQAGAQSEIFEYIFQDNESDIDPYESLKFLIEKIKKDCEGALNENRKER